MALTGKFLKLHFQVRNFPGQIIFLEKIRRYSFIYCQIVNRLMNFYANVSEFKVILHCGENVFFFLSEIKMNGASHQIRSY